MSTESKMRDLADRLMSHCKRLDLMNTDLGKAAVRIKVNGYGADLKGLDLSAKPEYTWEQEAIVEALAAFKRAKAHISHPDCDGDTFESADVEAMKRALDVLG